MCTCTYLHTSAGDRLQREELDRCDGTVNHLSVPTLHHTCAQCRILRDEVASLVSKLKDILHGAVYLIPKPQQGLPLALWKACKTNLIPRPPTLEWGAWE